MVKPHDPRGLIKSAGQSYYARPSRQEEDLKTLILGAGVASIAITFCLAILISYLGTELESRDVGKAIATSAIPWGIFLVLSMFLAGARNAVLVVICGGCFIIAVVLIGYVISDDSGKWPMYIPPLLFSMVIGYVSLGVLRHVPLPNDAD